MESSQNANPRCWARSRAVPTEQMCPSGLVTQETPGLLTDGGSSGPHNRKGLCLHTATERALRAWPEDLLLLPLLMGWTLCPKSHRPEGQESSTHTEGAVKHLAALGLPPWAASGAITAPRWEREQVGLRPREGAMSAVVSRHVSPILACGRRGAHTTGHQGLSPSTSSSAPPYRAMHFTLKSPTSSRERERRGPEVTRLAVSGNYRWNVWVLPKFPC